MKEYLATVKKVSQIAENVYAMTFGIPERLVRIKGGQFVNIGTGDNSRLLKRPLGIVECMGKNITVCFQVKGAGTAALSRAKSGDKLPVLLPLGNGFNIPKEAKTVAVIGGGVGIFPLVPVLYYNSDKDFYCYLGFRGKSNVCLLDEFHTAKKLKVVTDDGSYGEKGNAVDAYLDEWEKINADVIVACGPPAMLRSLKTKLKEKGINTPCFVSLEERMGCGVGACLVCTCDKTDGGKARVCKDGPVFDINEVEL